MGTYEISIPKWLVWATPFTFAIGFAVFFNIIGYATRLPKCSDFKTLRDAQALYDTNPSKYDYLDLNHDKKPCNGI